MRWHEIEISGPGPAAEAVANLLLEAGSQGVEICAGAGSDEADLGEERVRGYFPDQRGLNPVLDSINRGLRRVEAAFPGSSFQIHTRAVEDEVWAHQWRRFFSVQKPVPGLVIKPTWEEYSPAPGELIIELDPGMAFGTGTHATTVLCLEELRNLLAGGERVVDVGTGSGILAIASAQLGASQVIAVDSDPTALRVAGENLAINRVEGQVMLRQGDLLQGLEATAQVIVANISSAASRLLLEQAPSVLEPSGYLILSGVLERHRKSLEAMARENGLKPVRARGSAPWLALTLTGTGG